MTTIFTNNPAVEAKYPDKTNLIDTDVSGVFAAVRDAVHKGARVLSHPLSGSIKPWETPYKSIALSLTRGPTDFESLGYIENAIAVLGNRRHPPYSEEVIADFSVIDLDLIDSAVSQTQ